MTWKQLERPIAAAGELADLRRTIEQWQAPQQTLLDLRISGVLDQDAQDELVRLEELTRARFLYTRLDTSRLCPRPDDDRWLTALPPGPLRRTAERLQQLSDPAYAGDRSGDASPAVATRALLQLFRLAAGDGR